MRPHPPLTFGLWNAQKIAEMPTHYPNTIQIKLLNCKNLLLLNFYSLRKTVLVARTSWSLPFGTLFLAAENNPLTGSLSQLPSLALGVPASALRPGEVSIHTNRLPNTVKSWSFLLPLRTAPMSSAKIHEDHDIRSLKELSQGLRAIQERVASIGRLLILTYCPGCSTWVPVAKRCPLSLQSYDLISEWQPLQS